MRQGTEINIPEDSIREELAHLLDSKVFQQSDRLTRFLRFTIDRTLAGRQGELKEYAIGVEVYDRRPPYHPNVDSIVRTEARRLRAKLKEYYEGEGKDRDIYIYYRLGSYAPVFRRRETLTALEVQRDPALEFPIHLGPRPIIAVMPLRDLTASPQTGALAAGVTTELSHILGMSGAYRVIAASVTAHCQGAQLARLASRFGIQFFVEGSVQQLGTEIRVTFAVVNGEGFQIRSFRIHKACPEESADLFVLEERIASDLVRYIGEVVSKESHRPTKRSRGPQILSRTARTQQPFSEVNASLPPN